MKSTIIVVVKVLIIFALFEFIILFPAKAAARLYFDGGRVTKVIAVILGVVGAIIWLWFAWFLLGWIERRIFGK